MKPHRIVAGAGDFEPGAHFLLATALMDHAATLGCSDITLHCSRNRVSTSRYIGLTDRRGRFWRLRVSNHHKPRLSGPVFVHFDFISVDGRSGLGQAIDHLTEIAEGRVEWFDPEDVDKRERPRRPRQRRRGR